MTTMHIISKCILIIEDDPQYRRVVVRALEQQGYQVVAAEDFYSAISILEGDQHLDLLLTDVQMPAGTPNGVTIGRMATLRRSRLPIIYMTGSYHLTQLAGVVNPNEPILKKHFRIEDLLQTIRDVLEHAAPTEPKR